MKMPRRATRVPGSACAPHPVPLAPCRRGAGAGRRSCRRSRGRGRTRRGCCRGPYPGWWPLADGVHVGSSGDGERESLVGFDVLDGGCAARASGGSPPRASMIPSACRSLRYVNNYCSNSGVVLMSLAITGGPPEAGKDFCATLRARVRILIKESRRGVVILGNGIRLDWLWTTMEFFV